MTAFQLLSEPVRLFLLETLCVGEQTSGDLASLVFERFGIGWSATSRHLVTLRRSGLVRVIPDEMLRWYVLEDDWLEVIQREVDALKRPWEEHAVIRGLGFADLVPSPFDWPETICETRGAAAELCTTRRPGVSGEAPSRPIATGEAGSADGGRRGRRHDGRRSGRRSG
ncbi:hypothetical protein AX769_06460 [Frondihabitans sp. PAMC 28766]|uniref:ArsR/SmtB family transcription factor n=1 Tax=Frondihabitans sp. PAMC 28766 TaxID=1795630 RepID=UPI00078C5B90|nr:ArsR family transcriptional regulator [Frondihabitans sp. PAMC 28766]AMM19867.1 hypothetical protein AX769_06460 [Frondihabitans sp. PAMC 28766]